MTATPTQIVEADTGCCRIRPDGGIIHRTRPLSWHNSLNDRITTVGRTCDCHLLYTDNGTPSIWHDGMPEELLTKAHVARMAVLALQGQQEADDGE